MLNLSPSLVPHPSHLLCILCSWLNFPSKPKCLTGYRLKETLSSMKASWLASMSGQDIIFLHLSEDISVVASQWLTAPGATGRSPGSWPAWRWTHSSCTGHWPCWPACTCWTWCPGSPPSAVAPSVTPWSCKDSRERSQESTSSKRLR